ncbi:MAG: hypothetical protein B7Y81_16030 [Caulobacter sp. 32-67-35]|nr:MAG: hypothetical protein B7Y81_16030 [Caulobacter sp. 32-67-35]
MLKFVLLALTTAALASPALAHPVSSPGSWSFTLGGATDNRSKDASKTRGDPFVHGEVKWLSPDGLFYGGAGVETIESNGSDVEYQLNLGVRPTLAGVDLDLNIAHKWQADANPGADNKTLELTASVSRSIGPASARLLLQHSPEGAGATRAWTWVEARLGWDLAPNLSASTAVGRREQSANIDYTGWNAGVTYAVNDRLDLDLRWHDTDALAQGPQYAGALVAGLNVEF